MARPRPDDRFDALISAATAVFIERGYRRTQIADIAAALGVAKGTVYLYVESKEALFDLALRHADRREPLRTPARLPVRAPSQEQTLAFVRERLERSAQLPRLSAAVRRRRVRDLSAELEGIAAELYDTLAQNRVGLKLVDRCARDYPQLAATYHAVARASVPQLLERFLTSRARRGHVAPFGRADLVARSLMELVAFWAVHVHWDRSTPDVDHRAARATVIELVCRAVLDG